jgi:hypothetical protein
MTCLPEQLRVPIEGPQDTHLAINALITYLEERDWKLDSPDRCKWRRDGYDYTPKEPQAHYVDTRTPEERKRDSEMTGILTVSKEPQAGLHVDTSSPPAITRTPAETAAEVERLSKLCEPQAEPTTGVSNLGYDERLVVMGLRAHNHPCERCNVYQGDKKACNDDYCPCHQDEPQAQTCETCELQKTHGGYCSKHGIDKLVRDIAPQAEPAKCPRCGADITREAPIWGCTNRACPYFMRPAPSHQPEGEKLERNQFNREYLDDGNAAGFTDAQLNFLSEHFSFKEHE